MTVVGLDVLGWGNAQSCFLKAAHSGHSLTLVLLVILFLPQAQAVNPHKRERDTCTFAAIGAAAGMAITVASQNQVSVLGKRPKYPWLSSPETSQRHHRLKLVVSGEPIYVSSFHSPFHTYRQLQAMNAHSHMPDHSSIEAAYNYLYNEDDVDATAGEDDAESPMPVQAAASILGDSP